MKKSSFFAFAIALVFGIATASYAADQPKDAPPKATLEKQTGQPDDSPAAGHGSSPKTSETMAQKAVQGEIVKIDGEFYVVRDASGKEVRIHVDKDTMTDKGAIQGDSLKVGDRIEAEVTPQGHARSIKKSSGK